MHSYVCSLNQRWRNVHSLQFKVESAHSDHVSLVQMDQNNLEITINMFFFLSHTDYHLYDICIFFT